MRVRRFCSDRDTHCSIVRTSAIGCSGSIARHGGAHLRHERLRVEPGLQDQRHAAAAAGLATG